MNSLMTTNKMICVDGEVSDQRISQGIRPVWSEYLLCAQWVAKDPIFLHADSEDSDQTGWRWFKCKNYWGFNFVALGGSKPEAGFM